MFLKCRLQKSHCHLFAAMKLPEPFHRPCFFRQIRRLLSDFTDAHVLQRGQFQAVAEEDSEYDEAYECQQNCQCPYNPYMASVTLYSTNTSKLGKLIQIIAEQNWDFIYMYNWTRGHL